MSRKTGQGVREMRAFGSGRETTRLLDVNVLLALLDPTHLHHALAHEWFATANRSWASCNLTQNGALRIMSHPRYGNAVATTALAAELLRNFAVNPDMSGGRPLQPCARALRHVTESIAHDQRKSFVDRVRS